MSADLTALEAEVREAAAQAGLRPRTLALVSPLGARKGMRYAYRVDGDDGRVVKARHFGSTEEAERVHALRLGLEDAFAPVLQRCGAVLIEEWVEGEMLRPDEEEAWARPAGAILGRLHRRPLADSAAAEGDTSRWNAAAVADIALLREAEVIAPAAGVALHAALARHDPGSTRHALTHRDFCAENMLIDRGRRLRIIDTEQLAVGPIGFDLAWTWHRWPMGSEAWAQFMDGYRSTAPADTQATAYWRIATGLTLARVFFQRMPERLEAQLASLLGCLAEGDPIP